MPAKQSAEFKKAVEDSRKLKAKPSDNELLELYGLFKQGTQDPPFEDTKAPGMFELKEKAKRAAWQKLVDAKVTPEDAQERYIKLVEDLKQKHGFEG
ncbi:acyl-CoA-binding protein [Teratosphaeria nubilosa]|uniref:Acyl-CoA-binding protein n=1 Tax=Teratosphaeria nubilosa TaxID=161662 RepID=A0A6G1LNI8_9PEZI|nr:acyl-CoA-binding protein [Teratosphaeria nubilosa]